MDNLSLDQLLSGKSYSVITNLMSNTYYLAVVGVRTGASASFMNSSAITGMYIDNIARYSIATVPCRNNTGVHI